MIPQADLTGKQGRAMKRFLTGFLVAFFSFSSGQQRRPPPSPCCEGVGADSYGSHICFQLSKRKLGGFLLSRVGICLERTDIDRFNRRCDAGL
jgi:hypothetical protein